MYVHKIKNYGIICYSTQKSRKKEINFPIVACSRNTGAIGLFNNQYQGVVILISQRNRDSKNAWNVLGEEITEVCINDSEDTWDILDEITITFKSY